jgi:hypothetical protein
MVRKDVPHELRALREPQGYLAELIKMPRTVSWDILSRPCGTVLLQERINPLNAFAGSANAFRGGFARSFSAQVRHGEPGAPVPSCWSCYDTDSCGTKLWTDSSHAASKALIILAKCGTAEAVAFV